MKRFSALPLLFVLPIVPALVAAAKSSSTSKPATSKSATRTASRATAPSIQTVLAGVTTPAGFDLTLFAAPPRVNYPTCLTATPTGELFVGIDEQGSLGREANKGRVVRCADRDGDGVADEIITFAQMDHPRGLVWDGAAHVLYVLHPPTLTRYYDDNADGVADRSDTLLTGIGNDRVQSSRGADHTTNGIRLGIDGWIYIAVGDFGCLDAVGKDGAHLKLHGGGIVRVRTDGTGLETFVTGTRNIYDVAIDPLMNVFTRDNTNDGDGWNDRLAYDVPGGYYGYPSRFAHFPGEFVDCMIDFGGGSPCGALFVDEPALPEPLRHGLYTVEWGRSCVDRHPLTPSSAGFKATTEKLMDLPRGTDIDVDAAGRLYISSWANGGFAYSGVDVGYVVRLSPKGPPAQPFPDLQHASDTELLKHLNSPSGVCRQAAQREIIARGDKPAFADGLIALAKSDASLSGRVAAIFTLKILCGEAANPALLELCKIDVLREFALRALADRKGDAAVPTEPFIAALADVNPRLRLIAAWGLGRLEHRDLARAMIPLTLDRDPLVSHVAVNSLVALNAQSECLSTVSVPAVAPGALRVLQQIHDPAVVKGLIDALESEKEPATRAAILHALCRLYFREGDWDGSWWGTRPETSGPYFNAVRWEQTPQMAEAIRHALTSESTTAIRSLLLDCAANKIDLPEVTAMLLKAAQEDSRLRGPWLDTVSRQKNATPDQLPLLKTIAQSDTDAAWDRIRALRLLGDEPASDDAVEVAVQTFGRLAIAKKSPKEYVEALEAFTQSPVQARRVPLLSRLSAEGPAGQREVAFAALATVSEGKLTEASARTASEAAIECGWADPASAAALLRAIGRVKAEHYASQVRDRLSDKDAEVASAAKFAAKKLRISPGDATTLPATSAQETIASIGFAKTVAAVLKSEGDASVGKDLFTRQGCIACHTASADQPPKGPFLGGISARYNRAELCESIMKPSAKIAQGFETQWFKTKSNDVIEGFVTKESGAEIVVRNVTGNTTTVLKDQIKQRGTRDISVMPEGLVAKLTPQELASLVAYIESLKAK